MDNVIPLPSSVKERKKKDISFSCRCVSIVVVVVVLFHLCVCVPPVLFSVLEKCSARVGQFSSSRYHVVTLYSADDDRSHSELPSGRVLCCYCWFGSLFFSLRFLVRAFHQTIFKRGTSGKRRKHFRDAFNNQQQQRKKVP